MSTFASPLRFLIEHAGVYRTRDRVVRVRGDDARSWLNGQVSNDVRALAAEQARYALALTVKGRIVSDLWALEDAPGMALVLPEATADATLARLEQHIIMEDVELVPDDQLEVITVQGPRASDVVAGLSSDVRVIECARLASSGFDCWAPRTRADEVFAQLVRQAEQLGGGAVDQGAWAAAHVVLGVPRVTLDFGADSYPQEAGLKQRALSFEKGCYLGQEVVYMLHNRGQLPRRLVQLEAAHELSPGAAVVDAEGKRVGEVTSTAHELSVGSLALAYVKRQFAEPGQTVWVADSPCAVRSVVGEA
jgi:tRNA-modifying protein YgfZ